MVAVCISLDEQELRDILELKSILQNYKKDFYFKGRESGSIGDTIVSLNDVSDFNSLRRKGITNLYNLRLCLGGEFFERETEIGDIQDSVLLSNRLDRISKTSGRLSKMCDRLVEMF